MTKFSFELHPTGVVYDKKEDAIKAKKYDLVVGLNDQNMLSQIRPSSTKLFKPEGGWIKTNEPEEHLDEIAEQIKKYIHRQGVRIGCFSYKDQSLAERLIDKTPSIVEYTFNPAKQNSCEDGYQCQWPEECTDSEICNEIENMNQKYDLYIMRHYLEHFENIDDIITSINKKLKPNGLLYIEVPSCDKFIQRGNPLFMWEQHRIYFTKTSLTYWLAKNGLKHYILERGSSIEPSLCCLIEPNSRIVLTRDNAKSTPQNSILHSQFQNYLNSWLKIRDPDRYKVLLGIGHNSHRFLQLTNSINCFDEYIDSSKTKKGKYLGGCENPIQSEILISNNAEFDIVLGVHDRSYNKIADRLAKKYVNAKISSIFSDYR